MSRVGARREREGTVPRATAVPRLAKPARHAEVRARRASLRRPLLGRELTVLEPGEFGEERQLDGVHWPVPLLGDDDLGDALIVAILDVDFLAIDEGDDVRVLLDRTRL